MNGPHKLGAVVTAVVFLLTTGAAAGDPPAVPIPTVTEPTPAPTPTMPPFAHLGDPSILTTHTGVVLTLPPGYWMDEPTYDTRDKEIKRLQDAETRLGAENKSLRQAASGWQPGWKTLGTAIVTGVALGWYLHSKF